MLLRVSAAFFSLLSLKYITYSFFCSLCSLIPACCRVSSVPLCSPPPLPPGARPSVFLLSCLPSACPPDACCRVSPSVFPSPCLVPSSVCAP